METNCRITDYQQVFFPCYGMEGTLRIVIRMYYLDHKPYYLAVDPYTFLTETAPAANFKPRKTTAKTPGYFTLRELLQTPYMKALTRYTSSPYKLKNSGITHAEHAVNGLFLTIDMCPSVKPFETDFFNTLISLSEKLSRPIPIALAITGLWIIGHAEEFNWLINQEKENKLKITWINHTFSHVYYEDEPMRNNFLVIPQTNVTHEILALEKLLLEHDQLPSVYMRFPGLVANKKLILQLRQYGLIPIGTDAWLANNQQVKLGSFVLVHGNSNEPQGIEKVMHLLHDADSRWLPLSEAFTKLSN